LAKGRVYVFKRDNTVHPAFAAAYRVVYVGHLCRAWADKDTAYFFLLKSCGLHNFFLCKACGKFHWAYNWQHMVNKAWKTHLNKPYNCRAGGRYNRLWHLSQQFSCCIAYQFGCPCNLKKTVKATAAQACKYLFNFSNIVKLCVQCRCRQSNQIFIVLVIVHRRTDYLFSVIRANLYTFAAVYTAAFKYYCLAVSYAYSLGRTFFNTVDTAFTQIAVQSYRMSVFDSHTRHRPFLSVMAQCKLPKTDNFRQ